MANISEAISKSILIRARYRDAKLDELKKIKSRVVFCCICADPEPSHSHREEYKCSGGCKKSVCQNCFEGFRFCYECAVICTKCGREGLENTFFTCQRCSDHMCKKCVYDLGAEYTFCSKTCQLTFYDDSESYF